MNHIGAFAFVILWTGLIVGIFNVLFRNTEFWTICQTVGHFYLKLFALAGSVVTPLLLIANLMRVYDVEWFQTLPGYESISGLLFLGLPVYWIIFKDFSRGWAAYFYMMYVASSSYYMAVLRTINPEKVGGILFGLGLLLLVQWVGEKYIRALKSVDITPHKLPQAVSEQ